MKKPTYHCPECDSQRVTTEYHQRVMRNTWKHYCHSIKPQDRDSPATCLDCRWWGENYQLKENNNGT